MTKKKILQELSKSFGQLPPEELLKAIQANTQQLNIATTNLAKTARAASEFEINYANDELDFSTVPVKDVRKRLKDAHLAAGKAARTVQHIQGVLEGGAV